MGVQERERERERETERMDVRDSERRDKVVNCQFYGLAEKKTEQERASVKA